MSRPICAICERNACRMKGGKRADGSVRYDYKCKGCHDQGLKGNPNGALPRREVVAKQRLPGYEARLQRLIQQIANLQPVLREYKAIKRKVTRYRARVAAAGKRTGRGAQERYKRFKKESCELCGFVPEHKAQLDVDHVDGNGLNHDLANLMTLCANCHRLKTMRVGDHLTPRTKPGEQRTPHQTALDGLWREHDQKLS